MNGNTVGRTTHLSLGDRGYHFVGDWVEYGERYLRSLRRGEEIYGRGWGRGRVGRTTGP